MDPIFPLEIFDVIITQMSLNCEKEDLYSCSLVCKAFVPMCRPHIFKNIELHWHSGSSTRAKAERLINILAGNPVLKGHIEDIICTYRGFFTIDNREIYMDESDDSLSPLLFLPNVRCLIIGASRGFIDYTNFQLPDRFSSRSLIEHALISGNLVDLTLRGFINTPLVPILSCTSLINLELIGVDFAVPTSEDSVNVPQPNFTLRELRSYQATNFPLSRIRGLPGLTSLQLGGPLWMESEEAQYFSSGITPGGRTPGRHFRFDHLTSIFAQSGVDWGALLGLGYRAGVKALPAVKELTLELYLNSDVEDTNHILSHLQALEKLEVKFMTTDINMTPLHIQDCVSDMHQTLKFLRLATCWDDSPATTITNLQGAFRSRDHHALETLELHLTFCLSDHAEIDFQLNKTDDTDTVTAGLIQPAWRAFVAVLAERDRFPHLGRVELRMTFHLVGISNFKGYEDHVHLLETMLKEPFDEAGCFDGTTPRIELDFWARVIMPT